MGSTASWDPGSRVSELGTRNLPSRGPGPSVKVDLGTRGTGTRPWTPGPQGTSYRGRTQDTRRRTPNRLGGQTRGDLGSSLVLHRQPSPTPVLYTNVGPHGCGLVRVGESLFLSWTPFFFSSPLTLRPPVSDSPPEGLGDVEEDTRGSSDS